MKIFLFWNSHVGFVDYPGVYFEPIAKMKIKQYYKPNIFELEIMIRPTKITMDILLKKLFTFDEIENNIFFTGKDTSYIVNFIKENNTKKIELNRLFNHLKYKKKSFVKLKTLEKLTDLQRLKGILSDSGLLLKNMSTVGCKVLPERLCDFTLIGEI